MGPAPGACQVSRKWGFVVSANGLRAGGRASSVSTERLPVRVPGAAEVPDGPRAVLLPIEQLELIAETVRRWCAEPGGAGEHR